MVRRSRLDESANIGRTPELLFNLYSVDDYIYSATRVELARFVIGTLNFIIQSDPAEENDDSESDSESDTHRREPPQSVTIPKMCNKVIVDNWENQAVQVQGLLRICPTK